MVEWKGAARPASDMDFARVAKMIDVEERIIRAIWAVESAGKPFQIDGTLTRRFEPHHMKPPIGDWKSSMKIPTKTREAMFMNAYASEPEEAMSATSWGGPQIMGFNHEKAGFATAALMVTAFAESEGQQLAGFARLVQSWKLVTVLKAHDWLAFALVYNGKANGKDYAAKIETEYRRQGGAASPVVLKVGAKGPAVVKLQTALNIDDDGSFGPGTLKAVKSYQAEHGLTQDGVVGNETWKSIEASTAVVPTKQETSNDRVAAIAQYAAIGTTASGAVATVGAALPESTLNLIVMGVVIGAVIIAVLFVWKKVRNT